MKEGAGGGKLTNVIERYLESQHGPRGSKQHRLLMQAVLERRCLFLVDGVDEAGGAKEEIERAIADELLDQGHKTIVTSRHSGFKMESFERCQLVELLPMSHGQQEAMVRARLGSEGEEVVTEFMSALQSSAAYTEIANIPVGDDECDCEIRAREQVVRVLYSVACLIVLLGVHILMNHQNSSV